MDNIFGVKVERGKIIVNRYDYELDVPKDEVVKHLDELDDYIEELVKRR